MEVIVTFLISIILYFAVLVSKTINGFKESKIKVSTLNAISLTLYVFFVHVKIAYSWKNSLSRVLFVAKQFFFKYDIPVAILIEVISDVLPEKAVNVVENHSTSKNKLFANFFGSKDSKGEYEDILNDYCTA